MHAIGWTNEAQKPTHAEPIKLCKCLRPLQNDLEASIFVHVNA